MSTTINASITTLVPVKATIDTVVIKAKVTTLGGTNGIGEAPGDGGLYGRQSGAWELIQELDGTQYVLKSGDTMLGDLALTNEATLGNQVPMLSQVSTIAAQQASVKMEWNNKWVQGTYDKNDVVQDAGWAMVANKETDDTAAPIPAGIAEYLYSGTSPETTSVAKHVIFGLRVTVSHDGYIDGYRVYLQEGYAYDMYVVNDPEGAQIITQLVSVGSASTSGWVDFAIPPLLIASATLFDVVIVTSDPTQTPVTWFGNWDYTTPKNDSVPLSGVASHANKSITKLKISKTDDDGGNKAPELLSLTTGDKIKRGEFVWTIGAVTDYSTYVEFEVSPPTQDAPDGVEPIYFHDVSATSITYMEDPNYWTNEGISNVQGLLGVDVRYYDIVPNGSAYGIDLLYQHAYISPDWDVLAYAPAEVGGGEGGTNLYVMKSGDTMTGKLVLSGDASAALEPVTKQQLDNLNVPSGDDYVLKAGDTMTGNLGIETATGLAGLLLKSDTGNTIIAEDETGKLLGLVNLYDTFSAIARYKTDGATLGSMMALYDTFAQLTVDETSYYNFGALVFGIPGIIGGHGEAVQDIPTLAIDIANGNNFTCTLTANRTATFTMDNTKMTATSFSLLILNGDTYAVTFPLSLQGTAPVLTERDLLSFFTFDGGASWYWSGGAVT